MTTHRLIIGANYGDEGKGTVVAHYAKNANGKVLNVLTNGGSQRAHNIETETGRYKFQHFGAGTIFGADNLFSEQFIINPMQYAKEYAEKREMLSGITIYRHPLCKWSTPYDMMANQIIEMQKRTGSCGMGIWETELRYTQLVGLPINTFVMISERGKLNYLNAVKNYFEDRLGGIPSEYANVWNDEGLQLKFIEDVLFIYNTTKVFDKSVIREYDEVIYENGQGLLLNDNGKDDGTTTPSCTGSAVVRKELKNNVLLHYVTRPYITKHGGYQFDTEETNRQIVSSTINEDWANPYNQWQGDFRYGTLDAKDLKKRIVADAKKVKYIVELTHCDEMDREAEFKKLFDAVNCYDSSIIK